MPPSLLGFLRETGLAGERDAPAGEALPGGVSSDIWRVDLAQGPVCVKRALARLRVAERWEAPVERNRYERRWLEVANAVSPGAAPRVLAHDDAAGLFAMEWLGYPVWKAELAAGRADAGFAAQVGERLAAIHAATAGDAALAREFATDAAFHALRLEPYLLATARRHEELNSILKEIAEKTAHTKNSLVHGDVSPKNILVAPQGPVFLDAECAWYGDPAFDLAFCLNHLLLKCLWVPGAREAFLACFDALAGRYLAGVDWESAAELERRAATLLPGLLLARVDGKSPVEYLDDAGRDCVRRFATGFLSHPPSRLETIKRAWQRSSI